MTILSAWKIAVVAACFALGAQAQETDATATDATSTISKPNNGRAGSHRPLKDRGIQRHGPAAGFGNPPELTIKKAACDPAATEPCSDG